MLNRKTRLGFSKRQTRGGSKYYAYVSLYVDDVVCITYDAVDRMKLDKLFPMKPSHILRCQAQEGDA